MHATPDSQWYLTLLELVFLVQVGTRSDAEVVQIATDLVNSGCVVLTGSFAGSRILP